MTNGLPYFITVTNTVGPQEEDVLIGQMTRVVPLSEGERKHWGVNGCRIYLAGAVSSIMIQESREEVWARVHAALSEPIDDEDDRAAEAMEIASGVVQALKLYAERMADMRSFASILGSLRARNHPTADLPMFRLATNEEFAELQRLAELIAKPLPEIEIDENRTFVATDHQAGVHYQSIWRHETRKTRYGLIGFGVVQANEPLGEGDRVAMYVSLDSMAADGNDLWVRPEMEFLDGRFTKESAS